MKIEQTTASTITELWAKVESRVKQSKCLEEAAQELATALHTQFQESVVLARVYFTVPFGTLPAPNKTFVQNLAESAGAASDLKATTPVLSLIGTYGKEADWNDRHNSKGHVGIPLTSSAFVDAIPMISRLLKELGVPLDWVDTQDAEIIKKMDRAAGLFFVENAADAVDHQGRKIIPAQDFVSGYNVKTVFGVGGGYAGGQILVIVAFCRDVIPRATAERFVALRDAFKGNSSSLVETARIFS
ncbi:MAG: hypothetical protein ACE5JQ_08980 [Candidatus Methylomirabilales bacterium]